MNATTGQNAETLVVHAQDEFLHVRDVTDVLHRIVEGTEPGRQDNALITGVYMVVDRLKEILDRVRDKGLLQGDQ